MSTNNTVHLLQPSQGFVQAMYIWVNDPSLNRNLGKYHLDPLWDEVLQDIPSLQLKQSHQFPHLPYNGLPSLYHTPYGGHTQYFIGKYDPFSPPTPILGDVPFPHSTKQHLLKDLIGGLMRRPLNLKLKYVLEKLTLCDVWKLFSYVFLWRWRSEDSDALKCNRYEHRDGTSLNMNPFTSL